MKRILTVILKAGVSGAKNNTLIAYKTKFQNHDYDDNSELRVKNALETLAIASYIIEKNDNLSVMAESVIQNTKNAWCV